MKLTESERVAFGARNRAPAVTEYSIDEVVRSYEETYRSLLNASPAGTIRSAGVVSTGPVMEEES